MTTYEELKTKLEKDLYVILSEDKKLGQKSFWIFGGLACFVGSTLSLFTGSPIWAVILVTPLNFLIWGFLDGLKYQVPTYWPLAHLFWKSIRFTRIIDKPSDRAIEDIAMLAEIITFCQEKLPKRSWFVNHQILWVHPKQMIRLKLRFNLYEIRHLH